MSTIRVDNFGPSAGGTAYSTRGIAKAWASLDGTGTITVRDSENVASVTDNGTGDYTANLLNSMPSANYAAVAACNSTNRAVIGQVATLAGSMQVVLSNDAATAFDDVNTSTAYGDLA